MVIAPSQKRLVKSLKGVPLFTGMSNSHLQKLAKEVKLKSFAAGEMILKEGVYGVGFYLVLKGKVQAKKGNRVLKELGGGQFFGEMTLLEGSPRSADVVAVEPTKCFFLSFWDFQEIMREDPTITEVILKELVRRLRETDEMLSV